MDNCCENKAAALDTLYERQARVLKAVLLINSIMFFVEISAGVVARSTALLADSLDMLGDSLVYGFSLYVVARGARWRARAGLLKGLIMAVFGLGVLIEAASKIIYPTIPAAATMGVVGLLALTANSICLLLLFRHRRDDINMRSIWLCSRNDIIANISVLIAAGGVVLTQSMWSDVVVGLGIAVLFIHSAFHVLRGSVAELRIQPT
jgi:cation diffusion facilitator family transporter